jgi:sulfite reductase (ferredoxin)
MGRKFKIAFSSTEADSAFTFIHDVGFIPKIRKTAAGEERGFKTVIGGGLGSNPHAAEVAYEFLPTDQIIPFTESLLRVFDRYGERNRRMKARFKFLLKDLGVEQILSLVEKERDALPNPVYPIDRADVPTQSIPDTVFNPIPEQAPDYELWKATNVIEQKQSGYFGVYIKLPLGDLSSEKAYQFADIIDQFASNELRITVNQGYLLRYVSESALPHLFMALKKLGLADPGFDSVADITACPGTDSCNLGISNSTSISLALEKIVEEEFPDLVHNLDIKIKISGCPNSCGQHGLASIGFHGSSIKDPNGNVLPALVVLLGGGRLKDGAGIISEKIIKIPSKRGPDALRLLLNDYELNANEGEYYNQFYTRQGGRKYFYDLLKPLADVSVTLPQEYIDWGGEEKYKLETAVGECAGVIIDLVSTLFLESEEKLILAAETLQAGQYADSIYHSYSAFINSAKALLLDTNSKSSTHIQILTDFQEKFVATDKVEVTDFVSKVMQMRAHTPSADFAQQYLEESRDFLDVVQSYRLQKNKLETV